MITQVTINNRLQHDIKILVNGILKAVSTQPIAILLNGGYGRGEGAWFEDENGFPMPYNDYDLSVITEDPIPADLYRQLRKELAQKVGIKWVDIDCYKPYKLNKLAPTIHNVDLLYASTLIWGDKNWSQMCSRLEAKDIGYYDIIKLYRTRMWTLLGSWQGPFRDLDIEESRFFKNQMAKCGLACCDMLLISKHAYHTSYRRRAELVQELFPNFTEVCNLAKWAIEEKTCPSSGTIKKEEMESLYNMAHTSFINCFCYSLKPKISKLFLNPDNTYRYYRYNVKHALLACKMLLKGIYKNLKKQEEVFFAQNYILLAYTPSAIKNDYILKASKLLQKWGYINEPIFDWNQLRIIAANARNDV